MAKQNNKKTSWKQADYGKRFTGKDIKQLQSSGYNDNQILKIASAASQQDRWKTNSKAISKTDSLLSQLNQGWLNPEVKSGNNGLGDRINVALYPQRQKAPNKLLSWNGLGDSYRANPLSKFKLDNQLALATLAPGAYKATGKNWFLPPSLRNATTFGSTAAPTSVPEAEPTTVDGTIGEQLPIGDYGGDNQIDDPAPENPMSSQSGYGSALASWAAGWRQNKSSRQRKGIPAQGLAAKRINPTAQLVGI
jgi:hypothetical protein